MNADFTITSWKGFAEALKCLALITTKPDQTSRPSDRAIAFKVTPKNKTVLLSACNGYQTFSTELSLDSPPSETLEFAVDIFKAPPAPRRFDPPVQVTISDKCAAFKFGTDSTEPETKILRLHEGPPFSISKALEDDMSLAAIEIGINPDYLISALKALKVKGEPIILRITLGTNPVISPVILSGSKGLSAVCPVRIRNGYPTTRDRFEHLKKAGL